VSFESSEEICLNLSLEIGVPVSQGGAQAWGEAAVDGMLDMPLLGLGVGPEVGRTHLMLEESHSPATVYSREGLLHGRDRPFPVAHPLVFHQKRDPTHESLCAAWCRSLSSDRKARTPSKVIWALANSTSFLSETGDGGDGGSDVHTCRRVFDEKVLPHFGQGTSFLGRCFHFLLGNSSGCSSAGFNSDGVAISESSSRISWYVGSPDSLIFRMVRFF